MERLRGFSSRRAYMPLPFSEGKRERKEGPGDRGRKTGEEKGEKNEREREGERRPMEVGEASKGKQQIDFFRLV